MTEEKMKTFEAIMRLKDMKEGEKITWQHMEAIKHFFGDLIAKLPEPQLIATIHFDHLGQPHTLNDDVVKVVTDQSGSDNK